MGQFNWASPAMILLNENVGPIMAVPDDDKLSCGGFSLPLDPGNCPALIHSVPLFGGHKLEFA